MSSYSSAQFNAIIKYCTNHTTDASGCLCYFGIVGPNANCNWSPPNPPDKHLHDLYVTLGLLGFGGATGGKVQIKGKHPAINNGGGVNNGNHSSTLSSSKNKMGKPLTLSIG